MTRYDTIIRGGRLAAAPGEPADIAIAGGAIAAIGPELAGDAGETIDASGQHVLPGGIDAHVHLNEPGRTEWEGFASGTRALAAGGITSFCEMPLNAHPPTCDAASFAAKLAAAERSSLIDFALWGGLTPENRDQLDELAACGVIGLKAFMSNSGTSDFSAADDLTLYEGMQVAARHGLLVAVHAESNTITAALAQRAQAEGRTGVRDYLASRPIIAELEAINRAIFLAEQTGCALHIVHVSSGAGVAAVAEARARGVDVSCETCPHYLVLTEDDVERMGAVAKCAPPLRPQAEQDALWAQIAAGTLPMVASDHSPAPPDMKTSDNFFAVWGGIAGAQSTMALMISEGHLRRGLPLALLAEITAAFVARRFRLAPQKGALAVGADADLALIDLGASATLRADDLHYRHRISPYIGMAMQGTIARTIVRGTTVARDGAIVSPPIGRLLRPLAATAD
ncbi:allantoinase [Chloroflexia bacterium SDU3-3]|nr:allantoinase [Chloroflexia bacterium SDU3-3]